MPDIFASIQTMRDTAEAAANACQSVHEGIAPFAHGAEALVQASKAIADQYKALAAFKPPGYAMPQFIGFKRPDSTFTNE